MKFLILILALVCYFGPTQYKNWKWKKNEVENILTTGQINLTLFPFERKLTWIEGPIKSYKRTFLVKNKLLTDNNLIGPLLSNDLALAKICSMPRKFTFSYLVDPAASCYLIVRNELRIYNLDINFLNLSHDLPIIDIFTENVKELIMGGGFKIDQSVFLVGFFDNSSVEALGIFSSKEALGDWFHKNMVLPN